MNRFKLNSFRPNGFTRNQVCAFTIATALLGSYYLWAVRAAGYDFHWGSDLDGYYDQLARGFVAGHLYLPIQPSPKLLAMPDPWDARIDDSLKLFDAALYDRRYYLYHGPGPAVMLFVPWRLVSGHDLPENFALFLFCFGGALFACAALTLVLKDSGTGPIALGGMLLALGTSQAVPFLVNRVWVYEVAIGAGYFCVSAGLFFSMLSLGSPRRRYLAAAGLMFGLAIACRPHLGLVGAMAGVALSWRSSWRRGLAFGAPFAVIGAGVLIYNYTRFGNPLEFGNSYMLGAAGQNVLHLRAANLLPGLYYMLAAAPDFSLVFPWVRAVARLPGSALPAGYALEPMVGGLFLAPVLPLAFVALITSRHKALFVALLASASGILLFIAATGWSVQRYQADFLPLFLFAAIAGANLRGARGKLFALMLPAGVAINLALAVTGPYDEMVRNKPARFVKIAGWFSPVERYRPRLNPDLDLQFTHAGRSAPSGVREVLMEAGLPAYRYRLELEPHTDQWKLVSVFRNDSVAAEFPVPEAAVLRFHVQYAGGSMRVFLDRRQVLEHKIPVMVTAPAQVAVIQ